MYNFLNGFSIFSYNLKNGEMKYENYKVNSEYNPFNKTNKIINFKNNQNQLNNINQTFIQNKNLLDYVPKSNLNNEYWIIKNKNNKFKIIIASNSIKIDTLIYLKAGPFKTIEEAKNILNILSNWTFTNVI